VAGKRGGVGDRTLAVGLGSLGGEKQKIGRCGRPGVHLAQAAGQLVSAQRKVASSSSSGDTPIAPMRGSRQPSRKLLAPKPAVGSLWSAWSSGGN
jgi:hypothetical protein